MFCSFCLAIFHATLVLDLAGFCGIASRASVPLVATLFAAVGRLRLREILCVQADEYDDCQRCQDTHVVVLSILILRRCRSAL
jgi:hypothetical protein